MKINLIHKHIQQTPMYACLQLEEFSLDSFNFHF